ncbi:MAG: PAS domain S-box protein [Desulfarculaceae bacterium]|nr:PAS domain S-box protein [Desulfarculaceae bacterium]MCF8071505.1 PAS domain S-box protein [Desulfarculaceae bacterium]MCF8102320.1 PAS domain S-box protein [Desulfarculaceae bacterium]MCF8114784.1 PAS domain S-box protein [Desulfarculaceae bacterium]
MSDRQKILIVDDRQENLVALRQVLRDTDADLVEATSGNQALAATLDDQFALAILDVQMPQMSGYELAELLRDDPATKHMPIIFLTAHSLDEQSVFRGYESGGIDYIVKPYDPKIMMGKVSQFLEMDCNRRQIQKHRDELEAMVDERTEALRQEVLERHLAQRRVEHLNNVLKAIRRVNQLIVRAENPEELIREASRLLVDTRGYICAWILLGAPDKAPMGISLAARHNQAAFDEGMAALQGSWPACHEYLMEQDSDIALLSIDQVCRGCPVNEWQEAGNAVVTWLKHGEDIMGMMGVTVESGAEVTGEEQDLLLEVAGDIAFALRDIHISRQHDLFAEIVANSQEAMALVDREYRYLKANPSYLQMVGRREEEVEGRKAGEILGKRFFQAVIKGHFDRCLAGEIVRFETERKLPGSGRRVLEVIYSPCRDAEGDIYAIASAIRDVTELRAAEQALESSAEFLVDTGRVARVGGWSVISAEKKLMWTEVTREIHEVDDDYQPSLDEAFDFFHEDDRAELSAALQAALEQGKPYDLELRFITAKGNRLWTHTRCRPVMEDGKVVRLMGTFQDISERKRAESEREQLAAAIDQSSDAVMITDPEGNIQYVNPAFTRISGYQQAEVLGRNPRLLRSGEQDPAFYQELWETIFAGRTWHGDLVNQRKDGTLFTEEARISPVFDQSGAISNFVAIKTDITERLRLREERGHMEEQMRQAQKMESIGRLAGGVAHDFNNMLSIISGYAEIAAEEVEEHDPLHKNLAQILDAAMRSRDLTRQLLAFARRQTVSPRVIDLNEVLAKSQKMLGRLIGEDIDLRLIPCHDVWPVKLDPSQIDQIIANLAVNARDAISGVGGVSIETNNVTLDQEFCHNHMGLQPGDYVRLSFSDTGSGMDREILSQIFEPFFTSKKPGEGTGLGLSTVYGIVNQAGGLVDVYSEPGQGTTFNVYLPRSEETPDRETAPEKVSDLAGSETVLVVEDEVQILDLCHQVLRRTGYQVISASQPGEALLLAEKHQGEIHLLVTDVVMPSMNGKELKERLEQIKPGVKVLYMSGYTADIIAHRGVLADGVEFLQKPFATKELSQKVRRLLDSNPRC